MDADGYVAHYRQMGPILHSERLTLRPYQMSDVDIAIEVFTDPEVMRFAGGAKSEDTIREELLLCVRRGGNGCIGIWCVIARDNGEKLGTVALLPMPIEEHHTDFDQVVPGRMPDSDVEIGYFLKKSAWSKGYATEACTELLAFAFEDSPLAEVVATHDPGNEASRSVLLKTGFSDLGTRRSYGADGPFYRITRDEWRSARDS